MPKFLKVFLILSLFVTLTPPTKAQELFDTEFDITYEITAKGLAQISQDIKITNKQSDVVATNYSLTINDMSIFDATGSDEEGPIEIETTPNGTATTLKAEFNKQIIGIDRSLNWNLTYNSWDIASRVGEIWNVNIPKVETLDATKDYTITLVIPNSFGTKIYVSPKPIAVAKDDLVTSYVFDKETLQKKGITASFGNYQVLNFQLQYNLGNEGVMANYQEIALPPDILNRQQIYYSNINPTPDKIITDSDGNVLATYKVEGKSELKIALTGSVRISGRQINPEFGGKIGKIPNKLKKSYTKGDTFWEVDSMPIKEIAKTLLDEDLTTSQNAQKVYDYVTKNLDYDFEIENKSFVDRNGALKAALDSGPWACMEFTDLFIAITRAMGIPARELNGYAFTTENHLTPLSINLKSGDMLHSWAEFYDPNFGWIQVDPTWGTTSEIDYFTKLDTSHFVFSIKGADSEYPFPAGTYKLSGMEKQVEVEVAQDPAALKYTENFKVYKKAQTNLLKLLQKQEKYLVYNENGLKMFNLNNSRKDLIPFSSQIVHLPQGSDELYFEDFNGEGKTINFTVETGNSPKEKTSSTALTLIAISALLLCGSVYYFAIHPTALKRVLGLLRRLPRGQGQSPNQNSQ